MPGKGLFMMSGPDWRIDAAQISPSTHELLPSLSASLRIERVSQTPLPTLPLRDQLRITT
jgi:hypothetical protein